MRLGSVALKKLEEPGNSLEHWRGQVKEHGVEHVRKLLEGPLPVSQVWHISARQAVEEHEKEQQEQADRKVAEREAREAEAHEMLKSSHRREDARSYEQVQLGKWQLFAAFLAIVVAIWLAVVFS